MEITININKNIITQMTEEYEATDNSFICELFELIFNQIAEKSKTMYQEINEINKINPLGLPF